VNKRKLLRRIANNPKSARFTEMVLLLEAFGSTPDEALRELDIAKKAWIDAANAEGNPIPPPTYRPVLYQFSK